MMKMMLFTGLVILGMQACKNEGDYKTLRKEVLEAHDQVMMDGEIAINNKMKLDTVGAALDSLRKAGAVSDTLSERQQINALQANLNKADEQMNDWMHNFQADLDGKSNQEALVYFTAEKKKINDMDSLYQVAIKASTEYLKKFKK